MEDYTSGIRIVFEIKRNFVGTELSQRGPAALSCNHQIHLSARSDNKNKIKKQRKKDETISIRITEISAARLRP